MSHRILIVEDSAPLQTVIIEFLQSKGHVCQCVPDARAAMKLMGQDVYDLILTDVRLPGEADGFAVVEFANQHQPEAIKVVMSGYGRLDDIVRAIRLGAYDFVRKPLPSLAELGVIVERALEHKNLLRERKRAQEEIERMNVELSRANDRLAEEVERRTADLAKANRELRTLDEMKNNLLASVSHELRTPLVSVRGYTELFYSGRLCPIPEKYQKYLETCLRNIDRLLSLIDSLMQYAQTFNQRPPLRLELIDLRQIFAALIQKLSEAARSAEVSLELLEKGHPVLVHGDARLIEQSFQHILDNAIKFNRPGGRVWVEFEPVGRKLVKISVGDNGIGIPLEEQGRIFERFYQVDRGPTRQYGGTGIGLAIARDNLRLLGSELRVTSELGKGSVFYLTMPLAEDAPPTVPPGPEK